MEPKEKKKKYPDLTLPVPSNCWCLPLANPARVRRHRSLLTAAHRGQYHGAQGRVEKDREQTGEAGRT